MITQTQPKGRLARRNARFHAAHTALRAVRDWNDWNRIGLPVLVNPPDGAPFHTRTRSRAYLLAGVAAVIDVEGIANPVALDRLELAWKPAYDEAEVAPRHHRQRGEVGLYRMGRQPRARVETSENHGSAQQ